MAENADKTVDLLEQEFQPVDIDKAELDAALKVVQDEETAATGADAAVKVVPAEGADKEGGEKAGTGEAEGEPGEGDGKADQRVPASVVGEVRRRLRAAGEELTESKAALKLIGKLAKSGTLTAEQILAITSGEESDGGNVEVETDPYVDVNARELQLEQELEDGTIDRVKYRQGMQAIEGEKRRIDRELMQTDLNTRQAASVNGQLSGATKGIEARFPVLQKMTQQQLDTCVPIANAQLPGFIAKKFGEGTVYNPSNPEHVIAKRWLTAEVADRNFGEGKGPLPATGAQTTPKKPLSSAAIDKSPAALEAARRTTRSAADRQPPDLQPYAFTEDTELGRIERSLPTMTDEQVEAALKKYPELAAKLEKE